MRLTAAPRIVRALAADPGNRAAIIRSCEALGLLHIHEIRSPQPPNSSRPITTGSEKWMKVHVHADADDCTAALRGAGFQQILTAKPEHPQNDVCRQPQALQHIDFSKATALVFGNEVNGISPQMSELCDGDFCIPIHGLTESFNVSVAAAICVHFGRMKREQALGGSCTDMDPGEINALLTEYKQIHSKSRHFIKEKRVQSGREQGKGASKEERRRMWLEAHHKQLKPT